MTEHRVVNNSKLNNPTGMKIDSVAAKMIEAKRKLKQSFDQETLEFSSQ